VLLEFRVKNFRSLRDEQVFSMVASSDKDLLATHAVETGLKAAPHVLRTAAIYGANASGKSNLIKALQFMRGVVVESATVIQPGQRYDRLQTFRLDSRTINERTEFETTFLINGVRYQYGFAMTQERILEEYLYVYKNFKPQTWFERRFDTEQGIDIYSDTSSLKGDKRLWQRQTRENCLFLSMAAQLNSAMLSPVFSWFLNDLIIVNEYQQLAFDFTIQSLESNLNNKRLKNFLKAAGIDVDDIEIEKKKVQGHALNVDLATGISEKRIQDIDHINVFFWHRTPHGEARFDLFEESTGTRIFFAFSAPLFDVVEQGKTVIFDELESSLHPTLVQKIIDLFHEPKINSRSAQLIFATHNTSLLDAYGLLRRDQIWLIEKDKDQASSLIPLSDFSPRKGEKIGRGYLQGRYGAIPFLQENLGLIANGQ
jgi:uncharacterized protein